MQNSQQDPSGGGVQIYLGPNRKVHKLIGFGSRDNLQKCPAAKATMNFSADEITLTMPVSCVPLTRIGGAEVAVAALRWRQGVGWTPANGLDQTVLVPDVLDYSIGQWEWDEPQNKVLRAPSQQSNDRSFGVLTLPVSR